jgi:hypothetical protein
VRRGSWIPYLLTGWIMTTRIATSSIVNSGYDQARSGVVTAIPHIRRKPPYRCDSRLAKTISFGVQITPIPTAYGPTLARSSRKIWEPWMSACDGNSSAKTLLTCTDSQNRTGLQFKSFS